MGRGLRIEIFDRETNARVVEKVFHDFPVRLGRDPLNEIVLESGFVSKFHATLDARDGVILRDLGSRNGTAVRPPKGNLQPHERVDLHEHGMVFTLGPFLVTLEEVDAPRAFEERDRGGAMLSSRRGLPPHGHGGQGDARLEVSPHAVTGLGTLPPHAPPPSPPMPSAMRASHPEASLRDDLAPVYEAYRAAWSRMFRALAPRVAPLPPEERKRALKMLAEEFRGLLAEPDFQRLVAHHGVSLAELRPSDAERDEDAALQVMQELAQWFELPRPLAGTSAIVGFAQKIQDALDALFSAYVRLRDGLRKFESEFEVGAGQKLAGGASGAGNELEAAKTPAEVARHMLDWANPADGARAIRSVVADRMIHDMSLINGVVKGAGALLKELSPEALQQSLEREKKAGRSGFAVGPYMYKELWKHFEQRHADLALEEKDTFALLFGREFAQAYQQLFAGAVPEDDAPRAVRRTARVPPMPPIPGSRTPPPPFTAPTGPYAAKISASEFPPAPPQRPSQGPTGTALVKQVSLPPGDRRDSNAPPVNPAYPDPNRRDPDKR